MSVFAELDHPRAAAGTFTTKVNSPSDVILTAASFDRDRLTRGEQTRFDAHLAELADTRTGETHADRYAALTVTHVQQSIVFGRRGTAPQLLWQVHVEGGDPVTVPGFVAKACTAADLSDPLVPFEHRRNRARVAAEKATDERARLAGRVRGQRYGDLRQKEAAAVARLVGAEEALRQARLVHQQPRTYFP